VWGKWLVEPSNLPYFEYADDVEKTILGRVAEIIGSEYFPPQETLRRMATAAKRDLSYAPSVMSFLTMVALELIYRPPVSVPERLIDLAEKIMMPLTEEQRRGRERLFAESGAKELKCSHILAVSAALWDGAVTPAVAEPLCEDLSTALEEDMRRIAASKSYRCGVLLTSFRLMGVRFLSREVAESWLNNPIDTILGGMVSDFDSADPNLTRIAAIPLKHFKAVYEIVERVLSLVEVELVDGVEESFPLASLDPFIVEKQQEKEEDATSRSPRSYPSGTHVSLPPMPPPVPAVTPGRVPEMPSLQWSDRKDLLPID
jgi:hypothetical protein